MTRPLILLAALVLCTSGLLAQTRLEIKSSSPPDATVGEGYGFQLSAAGGSPPYSWDISGLPPGLSMDSATGFISGTPDSAGSYSLYVSVEDSGGQSASAQYPLTVHAGKPLQILTTSVPAGVVGTPYSTAFVVIGGFQGYTFTLSSGTLPGGLTLSSGGVLSGTPTVIGQFRFSVRVTDSRGSTDIGDYVLTIAPPPLVVTGSAADTTVGSAINIQFGATGGVPPYTFAVSGSIPSGTRFSGGALTGTATAAGAFQFTIAVTDSRGTVATRTFILTVRTTPLRLTGTAGNGQVGVAYSAQFDGAGGTAPYSFTATGLPPGLRLTGGTLSGTPTADGTFAVSVTVTDAAGGRATGEFTVIITRAPLSITTSPLPNGTAGSSYSATLAATGGTPPYVWTISGLPDGVTASSSGTLSGVPTRAGTFTLSARVTDARAATATASLTVTIAVPPLTVTTASLPSATVGTALASTLSAAGGSPPYSFSATGLPGGVSLFPSGALSGAPTAPGTATIVVTVSDSAGVTVTRTYTMTVGLPSAPAVNLTGLPASSNPAAQPRFQVALGTAYPGPVTVTLTLAFTADSGPDDPAIQFSGGGRTAQIMVPAGATASTTDIGLQTGTVAGNITITSRLSAFSSDITPSPAPARTIRINPTAPVITSVTAARNATGFTLTIAGYASSRELTQAMFQFAGAAASNLQTTQLSVPVDTLFTQWYGSAASAPFGSQFILTQPFTVQGNAQSVASVTVTLVNRIGSSSAVTANLQ